MKNQIGERVRKRRLELGMSQEELALKMGYKDRSAITRIEKGNNEVRQNKIVQFAEVLNTTPGYLMGWEDSNLQTNHNCTANDTNCRLQSICHGTNIYGAVETLSQMSEEERNALVSVIQMYKKGK